MVLLVSFTMLLTGCNKTELVQDISQKQAHEIVSLLSSRGIYSRAEKQTGAGSNYTVTVKERHYAAAIDLMNDHDLPGKPKENFADLVRQKGLMPNSRDMEQLRLDHALAVQLEEVIARLPEVLEVKAIVRYHFRFGNISEKPGASVLVTVRPEVGRDVQDEAYSKVRDEVRQIVSSAIPALPKEHIYLSIQSAVEHDGSDIMNGEIGILNENGKVATLPLTTFLFGWHVSEEDHNALSLFLALFLIFTACVGGLIGYWAAFVRAGGGSSEAARDYELPGIRTNVLKIGNESDGGFDRGGSYGE